MSWESLVEAIIERMEVKLSTLNTATPGIIVAYDAMTNRATVLPSIPRRMADGTEVAAAEVHQVPVVFPTSGVGGKQAALTFPLAAGDGVELTFQQRCTEDWRSGRNTAPTDPRQYSQSDAVATPGLNAAGVSGDPDNVVLRFDQAALTIKPDGEIVLGNANGAISIDAAGVITLQGTSVLVDTPARSFVLEVHVHIETQAGPDTTGLPI
jgi:hypothetical protein